jgi:hypothetical protein
VFCGSLALANTGAQPHYSPHLIIARAYSPPPPPPPPQERHTLCSSAARSLSAIALLFSHFQAGTSPAPFSAPTAWETSLRPTSERLASPFCCVLSFVLTQIRYGVTDQNSNTRYSAVPQVCSCFKRIASKPDARNNGAGRQADRNRHKRRRLNVRSVFFVVLWEMTSEHNLAAADATIFAVHATKTENTQERSLLCRTAANAQLFTRKASCMRMQSVRQLQALQGA